MNALVHLDHKKILKVLLKDGRFLHICTIKNLPFSQNLPDAGSSERNVKYCTVPPITVKSWDAHQKNYIWILIPKLHKVYRLYTNFEEENLFKIKMYKTITCKKARN
jgi:hypothetical protein